MVIFLFINSVVIITSFLIAHKILRNRSLPDFFISWFILYFAQIVFVELALGIAGILTITNVVFLNLVLFLLVYLMARKNKAPFRVNQEADEFKKLLNFNSVRLIVAILLGFSLVKVFMNLFNPPLGWDDLNYHFTFAVEWLKNANLVNPITISDDPSPPYYPVNASLLFFWLMLPLKNVFLADLGQVPFFVVAFLAIYSLGRKLTMDRKEAFLCACLFTLIPNYFKQMRIAYVDAMVAALFLACLNYLFSLRKSVSYKIVVLFSIAFGLFLGIKTICLPYGILLYLMFLFIIFKKKKHFLRYCVISIVIILIFGGFSYFRNFMLTGNPMYPLDFNLFGRTVFRGVMDMHTYRAHFNPADYNLSKLLFHEGIGLQSLLFILPFVFLALPVVWVKKKKGLDFSLAFFLMLPALIYLIYRFVIPLANTRYLYPLFGCGIIAGFYTLKSLNFWRKPLYILVLICVLASIPELAKRTELIYSVILSVSLFFLLPYLLRKKALIFASVTFLCLLPLSQKYYLKNEYPGYLKMVKYSGFWPDATHAWVWLNNNTTGNNVAYIGRPVPFPLYGTNFKNNVYYISVNKIEPAKLHYFANSRYGWGYDFMSLHDNLEAPGNYRSDADYSLWLKNLVNKRTDYLFVYSLHQTKDIVFPMEDKWASIHADKFNLVFKNDTIHIYKVIR